MLRQRIAVQIERRISVVAARSSEITTWVRWRIRAVKFE